VCTVLVVSLKTKKEKNGYDMRNISDGRTHLVLVWRKILFGSHVRDKHCFVRCILCICLNAVTILYAFCVNYSPPQIRNTCEAFMETNVTHVFLLLIYDVYVTTVSSLIT